MLSAIIVTGGKTKNGNDLNTVEVIREDGTTCSLPSLPSPRFEHSQSGLEACGGFNQNVMTTCTRLENGVWTTSHNLIQKRKVQTSWTSKIGIFLFGGYESQKTTELLSSTSNSSTPTFQLPYGLTYILIRLNLHNLDICIISYYMIHIYLFAYFRHACGIEVPSGDAIIITGGLTTTSLSRVQKYSTRGATQQLPDLQQERYTHACSYFFNNTDLVSMDTDMYIIDNVC